MTSRESDDGVPTSRALAAAAVCGMKASGPPRRSDRVRGVSETRVAPRRSLRGQVVCEVMLQGHVSKRNRSILGRARTRRLRAVSPACVLDAREAGSIEVLDEIPTRQRVAAHELRGFGANAAR